MRSTIEDGNLNMKLGATIEACECLSDSQVTTGWEMVVWPVVIDYDCSRPYMNWKSWSFRSQLNPSRSDLLASREPTYLRVCKSPSRKRDSHQSRMSYKMYTTTSSAFIDYLLGEVLDNNIKNNRVYLELL
jgi:hypothetical protein